MSACESKLASRSSRKDTVAKIACVCLLGPGLAGVCLA